MRAHCTLSSSPSCCALSFSTFSVCLPPCAQMPDAAPARLLRAPAACASGSLLCFVCFCCCWSCRCRWLAAAAAAAAAASLKFCVQPTAAAFPLLLPARGQALAGARFFIRRCSCLRTQKKTSRYVAARLCALCFVSLCACALCVYAVRHYLLFHFHFGGEGLSPRTITCARAHAQHNRAQ